MERETLRNLDPMRRFILLGLMLGALLGVACADDDDSRSDETRRDDPYSGYEGDYGTNMELTEVDCSMMLGNPILNGRLMVYKKDDHLLFDGPFLLDRELFHEMRFNSHGVLEYTQDDSGRTFTLTATQRGDQLVGDVHLEFPGCVAKGKWSADPH